MLPHIGVGVGVMDQSLHSNAPDLTRNWNFQRVQPVEDGDVIESKSQDLHREKSIQSLNYEMPRNMTLEIAASAPLEYGDFVPMQLECFQVPMGDSTVHMDTSHTSANALGGLHLSGSLEFYNVSPTFYPPTNAMSTAPGITPLLEGRRNYLGYSNAVAHSFNDPSSSRFLGMSEFATGRFPAIKPGHDRLSDPKSLIETSQQRGLRRCRNFQRNRPPYGSQRLLQPDPRKPVRGSQPQYYYPYEHQARARQSSIGFRASEPMSQPDMSPYQYPNWISRSNIENDFNNPRGDILPDLKICPDIGINIKDKDGPNVVPATLSDHVAYQYSTRDPAGELNAIDVLNCITTRPNPEINLGAIDMSCAFVICRITARDYPIVYVSSAFRRLTGYSHEETVGRDCRFLQQPTGAVEPGLNRRTSDDKTIHHLKLKINARSEVQECLVNYRKGGQPFLNLLSVIPIRWLSDEYNFSVGFQVDLVDSPQAVTGKNGGSYLVNYRRVELVPNIYDPGGTSSVPNEYLIFEHQNCGNSNTDKFRDQCPVSFGTSWNKVLLGSSEFLFHIVSTTGVFLYVTPSISTILEYEPKELNGSTISSICHPSDVVTVIRGLRDSEPGSAVNLLYRIRRKISGYAWFESLGSVYIEPTHKQKYIALLGKLLVVFAMSRDTLTENGGINEGEIWAKISPSGILLFVSSSASAFLDRRSEDLVGESVQNLLSGESRAGFENALGIAGSGKRVACKHELQHRRGHLLQVQSTIYPGEKANEASKPMFLILQIRLLKLGRTIFGFQANMATTRTWKKNISNITMRQPIASDTYPRPRPDFTDHSFGDQNIRSSSSSSRYNRQNTTIHPVLKPDPTNIATYNRHTLDPFLPSRQQEQEKAEKENKENCNIFEELNPTRATNWQTELNHLKKRNRMLVEELQYLTTLKKKRKRKRDVEMPEKDCSQCHTKTTPEWRRGPSGNRDLCNSCGLRWAKQVSTDFLSMWLAGI
ncbi:hypothetical protein EMCG_07829 [[Emmonsia] crescens]|uniref:White collar 1 protein n=1 Tax=[Emmonsia] crescens TaxID=73230 RepID=A0A0G2I757_9EURO|nr:hypothetical protein EMCG_07829 [Emmonsia crescens UAMH 3008]